MILVVDTGPLVAAFNKKDRAHEVCTELLTTTSAQLVVPAPVLTEVCYLIETRNGTRAEAAFLTELARGTMTLEPTTRSDLARMAELVTQYDDLPRGGVDASVIAIAERLNAADIATLDRRHFFVVRPRHMQAFTLHPN
ncbi:MAG: type II toxin-antitoxin system VapC family toxin [Pseudonocardiaceae bacterium]